MTGTRMSSEPWEEMTRRWREMYQEHAALAQKNWQDGQTQLASALAGGAMSDRPASATAFAELWRSWTTFGELPVGIASRRYRRGQTRAPGRWAHCPSRCRCRWPAAVRSATRCGAWPRDHVWRTWVP